MKIFFLRHGQTSWNALLKLQGRSDIPLNESGKEAALKCGEKMAEIPFDICITSPLSRAVETAALILSKNHCEVPEPETDERIIEYCFGEWEGRIFKGPGYDLPVKEYGDYWESLDDETVWPGMEGKAALVARVRSFLDELCERYGKEDINILVVAHGAVMRAVHVIADDSVKTFRIRPMENCEAVLLEPDENAKAAQQAAGIKPGDLKYGRKLKMKREQKS